MFAHAFIPQKSKIKYLIISFIWHNFIHFCLRQKEIFVNKLALSFFKKET